MCTLSHCPFKVDDLTDEMGFDNMAVGPALNTDMNGKFRVKRNVTHYIERPVFKLKTYSHCNISGSKQGPKMHI